MHVDLPAGRARRSRSTTQTPQAEARGALGITTAHLLVNVKRLHPLAGQRYLLEAMTDVVREHPDTRLVICGTGALLPELQAVARSAGVERHVTFAGLVDNAVVARYCAAADLFVLPSLLEALPTVAVEALACGTPVISSDNPGGVELNGVFGDDVAVVPREQPLALARAIVAFLDDKRRTTAGDAGDDRAGVPARQRRRPLPRALRRTGRRTDAGNRSGGDGMIRGAGRVAAVAAIAALAGAAWLALLYSPSPALTLEFNTTAPAAIVRGIYTAERDDASGRTFAWTTDRATIRLDDLDRQVAWSLDLTVRGARAGGAPNPELQVFADGVHLQTIATTVDFAEARIAIPPQPTASRLMLELRSSSTFVPGPGDTRQLGVMLDRLALTSEGIALPPRAAFAGVALASAAAAAGVAALGVTAGSAVGAALVISAGLAALVAHGFGPYTDFASVAARTSLWIVLVGAVLIGTARAIRKEPYRQTARFAIAFSGAALLLKLLVLLHPNMPIGDALFHAHRFHEVDRCITRGLAGSWLPVVYGNGTRIIQTPDSVIIAHEMVHEARVIPLDPSTSSGSPRAESRGDGRAHMGRRD